MNIRKLHLTDEEVACCAEALYNNTLERISNQARTHLKDCSKCAVMVLRVHQQICEINARECSITSLAIWQETLKKGL